MAENQFDTNNMEVTSTKIKGPFPKWSKCVQCKSFPQKKVFVLPCLHIMDNDCLEQLYESTSACPECFQRVDRNTVQLCSYLNENIVEEEEETDKVLKSPPPMCFACVRKAYAHRWCQDCEEFLCELCTDHHCFAKLTRGHVLLLPSEAITDEKELSLKELPASTNMHNERKCSLHTDEDLEMFCKNCKSALCSTCMLNDKHKDHSLITLKKLADEFEKEFNAGIDTLKTIQEQSKLAIKELETKLKAVLSEQKLFLHGEARIFIKRLVDALLQREITLRKDLVEATLIKAKELNIKKARAASLIKQCTQYMDVAQTLIDNGTYWDIFHQEQSLRRQYKELAAAHSMLTDVEKFDTFIEKDFFYSMDDLPVKMCELWISKICEPVYTNLKKVENGSREAEYFQRLSLYSKEEKENSTIIQSNATSTPTTLDKEPKVNSKEEESCGQTSPVKRKVGRPRGSQKTKHYQYMEITNTSEDEHFTEDQSEEGRTRPKRIISAPRRLDEELNVHSTRLSAKTSRSDNLYGGKKRGYT